MFKFLQHKENASETDFHLTLYVYCYVDYNIATDFDLPLRANRQHYQQLPNCIFDRHVISPPS